MTCLGRVTVPPPANRRVYSRVRLNLVSSTSMPDLLGALHVDPVEPAAAYLGGKRNLAKRLVRILDSQKHDTYAEPFVGMGGIFLRRSTQPAAEIINDISGDVVTFFRVLQEHYPYFTDMLRWRLAR